MYTGPIVPESGIYKVVHQSHRLPHEVTLIKGQAFPRCSMCRDAVNFEVVHLAPYLTVQSGIVLYELPAFETGSDQASVA